MKVIEGPKTWSEQKRCRRCDRLVEIEPDDVAYENHAVAYASQTNDWRYVVRCICDTILLCEHSLGNLDVERAARVRAGFER